MIETANLLDMEHEISRRGFMRRMFAMGAGIAASGALARAADALAGPRSMIYTVTIDRAAMVRVSPSPEAFVDWANAHFREARDRLAREVGRQVYGRIPSDQTLVGYFEVRTDPGVRFEMGPGL
jgi:hypothetical protein